MQDFMFLIAKEAQAMGFKPGEPIPLENKSFKLELPNIPTITGIVSYIATVPSVLSLNCGNTWLTRLIHKHEIPQPNEP